ncbi:MAG: c-type cytochrome biogenesis protein CcmI [Rhizobiaceae bacterium]
MIFWILALVMVAAAVLCVLVPLSRKRSIKTGGSRTKFYEQQLQELGLNRPEVSENGLAQERAEIGRRLLASQSEQEEQAAAGGGRDSLIAVSLGALLFIPGFTMAMYTVYGAPGFEVARPEVEITPVEQQSVTQLVAAAERQLQKNPDDLRGWTVVAAVYGRSGQFDKRANALSQIIRLSGPNASLLAELAEARSLANGGIVSEQTVSTLKQALEADPGNIKARAYLLLATEQEGRFGDALTGWHKLLESAKGHKVWEDRISQRIAALQNRIASQTQIGPSNKQVEEAAKLAPGEQQAMIENMVAGLAQRLEDDPDDIEGWLRLLRSYHVLGKRDEIETAWQKSRGFFAGKPEQAARLIAALKEFGYSIGEDGALKDDATQ